MPTPARLLPLLAQFYSTWEDLRESQFPYGRDPHLPLLDIVWWVNRELIIHTGEVGYVRALYRARDGSR